MIPDTAMFPISAANGERFAQAANAVLAQTVSDPIEYPDIFWRGLWDLRNEQDYDPEYACFRTPMTETEKAQQQERFNISIINGIETIDATKRHNTIEADTETMLKFAKPIEERELARKVLATLIYLYVFHQPQQTTLF